MLKILGQLFLGTVGPVGGPSVTHGSSLEPKLFYHDQNFGVGSDALWAEVEQHEMAFVAHGPGYL